MGIWPYAVAPASATGLGVERASLAERKAEEPSPRRSTKGGGEAEALEVGDVDAGGLDVVVEEGFEDDLDGWDGWLG